MWRGAIDGREWRVCRHVRHWQLQLLRVRLLRFLRFLRVSYRIDKISILSASGDAERVIGVYRVALGQSFAPDPPKFRLVFSFFFSATFREIFATGNTVLAQAEDESC